MEQQQLMTSPLQSTSTMQDLEHALPQMPWYIQTQILVTTKWDSQVDLDHTAAILTPITHIHHGILLRTKGLGITHLFLDLSLNLKAHSGVEV